MTTKRRAISTLLWLACIALLACDPSSTGGDDAATNPDADDAETTRVFAECRFGFEQVIALAVDDGEARRALRSAHLVMAERAARQGEPVVARRHLAEVEDPPAELLDVAVPLRRAGRTGTTVSMLANLRAALAAMTLAAVFAGFVAGCASFEAARLYQTGTGALDAHMTYRAALELAGARVA